jgi:hypothetical protein
MIKRLPYNVILITGNSDYSLTDILINQAPRNILRWYAQNALCNNKKVIALPLGITNGIDCHRDGHGVCYPSLHQNVTKYLNKYTTSKSIATKYIYSNFNTKTNEKYREKIKSFCVESSFIEWHEPNLSLDLFYKSISQYKMVVCPIGNGCDTHRLWEVLYLNRVPIVIKPEKLAIDCYEAHGMTNNILALNNRIDTNEFDIDNSSLFQLYKKLPIVILDSPKDLLEQEKIEHKYNMIMSTAFDLSFLHPSYWIQHINNTMKGKICE